MKCILNHHQLDQWIISYAHQIKPTSIKYINEESKQLANLGREPHPMCVRIVINDNINLINLS
jgi:hypothetical protein